MTSTSVQFRVEDAMDATSEKCIVQGMHSPRDVSTEERALQGTHCPRDETSETFRSGTHRLGTHHHDIFMMDSRFLPSSQISGRMYNIVVSNKFMM
jgi:hypothetical protein